MNQKLFLKLNQLLADAVPTKIIKRGNAFSLNVISNKDELISEYEQFKFSGLNIYQTQTHGNILSLSGECFYTFNSKELEMETEIHLHNSNEFQIQEFCLDLSENTIFIKIEPAT